MEKQDFRSVIKYLRIQEKTPKQIKQQLDIDFPGSSLSLKTVYKWYNRFQLGFSSVCDEPRPGQLQTAVNQENVEKVRLLIEKDKRVTIAQIADKTKKSKTRVQTIIKRVLKLKKISAQCVPRLITPEQKLKRVKTSKDVMSRIRKNPKDFYRRLVTIDESWVHHYTLETNQQSKQWRSRRDKPTRKAMAVKSAGKVMFTSFWDSKGIILNDYLEKGRTINSVYYVELLKKMKQAVVIKRPDLFEKKILLLQDNASPHTSKFTTAEIAK